ncbi:MAG: hypothetical protein U0704_12170, partial [Candidatus Eisenbacteria bacterium]
ATIDCPINHHRYQRANVINRHAGEQNPTWEEMRSFAAAQVSDGRRGYLATISDAREYSVCTPNSEMGMLGALNGSWVTGPETGDPVQLFWPYIPSSPDQPLCKGRICLAGSKYWELGSVWCTACSDFSFTIEWSDDCRDLATTIPSVALSSGATGDSAVVQYAVEGGCGALRHVRVERAAYAAGPFEVVTGDLPPAGTVSIPLQSVGGKAAEPTLIYYRIASEDKSGAHIESPAVELNIKTSVSRRTFGAVKTFYR